MCGICGIIKADNAPVERAPVERMTAALSHRGPDAEGFFLSPGVAMGHRRLSVIDLALGAQPMTDPRDRATVSYNGEIYNFRELRKELTAGGFEFRTRCDTEVLLAGYLRWGEEVIEKLVGMFAFAVWDHEKRTLLLARDRLGQKPLYWGITDSGIAFSSELTSLLECGWFEKTIDSTALAEYVTHGYVLGEQSIIKGIKRLPPGQKLVWRKDGPVRQEKYWDLAQVWRESVEKTPSSPEANNRFEELLTAAVEERLVSDVPLGTFLSGGLDSSAVTALTARRHPDVNTFSIGFSENSFDESPWALKVATALGTTHHPRRIGDCSAETLLEIVGKLDEPFADTSIVPSYELCRFTREGITVSISGDGADEMLGGYVTLAADRVHRMMESVPRPLLRTMSRIIRMLPDSRRKVNLIFKLKQFFRGALLNRCDAHASWRMLAFGDEALSLLQPEARPAAFDPFAKFRRYYDEVPELSEIDKALYVDMQTWLPDDILFKMDRASMAHGLEVRSPFLDHRLVEFSAGLPGNLKLNGFRGKEILRQVAKRFLPPGIIGRRKAGFNAPVSQWINGAWKELARDSLAGKNAAAGGILDPEICGRLLAEHNGGRDHGYILFSLLMLSLWVQRLGISKVSE